MATWKYWAVLAAKLMLAVLATMLFWSGLKLLLPPPTGGLLASFSRLGTDLPYTFAVGFAVIFGFGLGWATAVDQLYRCRRCARRLRMPQSEGSLGAIWLGGAPYVEYICTYGHGKLLVPSVHLESSGSFKWKGYGSLWENLIAADQQAPPDDRDA